jgi:hypothetical protein
MTNLTIFLALIRAACNWATEVRWCSGNSAKRLIWPGEKRLPKEVVAGGVEICRECLNNTGCSSENDVRTSDSVPFHNCSMIRKR